ncbi:MAG TPA: hypothetical protein ENG37_01945 [Firmicutes bacterium]|nr:hypothetical protein [Bacillota bacterium]
MVENKKSNTPLKYLNGYYIGKEYKKTFDNEDGTKTKSFRYKFQVNSGEETKELAFWGYDITKGVDTLEGQEGELFAIGFMETENDKGDYPIKKMRFIGKPKGEVSDLRKHDNPSSIRVTEKNTISQGKWRDIPEFLKMYKSTISAEENTENLCVRMYFLNNPQSMDICDELVEAWNKEFSEKKEESLKR